MNRIISIFTLILFVVGFGYSYYTGLLGQFLNPQIRIIVAERNMVPGQTMIPASFAVKEVSLSATQPGMIVYPTGMSKEEIAKDLLNKLAVKRVKKGDPFKVGDFEDPKRTYIMRASQNIGKGEKLEMANVMAVEESMRVPEGTITFSKKNAPADLFLMEKALTASQDISEGDVIAIEDVSTDGGSVYVLETRGSFEPGDLLSLEDVRVSARVPSDLPRASIAFPSLAAGEIFISTSGGVSLSRSVAPGQILMTDMIAGVGHEVFSAGELPRTVAEYLEYKAQFPGRTILVDEKILVGGKPLEGDRLDLWIEMESTEGPYGVIKIKKVAQDSLAFRVVDRIETEGGLVEEFKYWSDIGPKPYKAIEDARQDGRIAFMINGETGLTDFIGNGAVCKGDLCSVSRSVSDDLRVVRLAFDPTGELINEADQPTNDPLVVLDGVDAEIEKRLIGRGYSKFLDIAMWDDSSLKVIAFNLQISENLAVYIRQQARNIMDNPERSRRDLGLSNGDVD